MTVEGTEQRVYGTLLNGCIIWLKRFKVTYGSEIIYGDEVTYKNCGYKQKGYLSLLFIQSGNTLPYVVFEIRKCRSGKNYIFIETYGEIEPPSSPLQCWFNQGTEITPDWVLLRTHTTGIMSTVEESTFKFNETKRRSMVNEIACCKKCKTDCKCLNCASLVDRIYPSFYGGSVVTNTLPITDDRFIKGMDECLIIYNDSAPIAILGYKYNCTSRLDIIFNTIPIPRDNWWDWDQICISMHCYVPSPENWTDEPINDDWSSDYPWDHRYYSLGLKCWYKQDLPSTTIVPIFYQCVQFKMCNSYGNKTTAINSSITHTCIKVGSRVKLYSIRYDSYNHDYHCDHYVPWLTGTYEADISEVDTINNSLTFSNIVFTGISSDDLSDRSYTIYESSFTYEPSFINNSSEDPAKLVGYCGPPSGNDATFICDISATYTITGRTYQDNDRYIEFFIGPENPNYPGSHAPHGQLRTPYLHTPAYPMQDGPSTGSFSGTLGLCPVYQSGAIYVKRNVYFGVTIHDIKDALISVEVTNIRVINSRGDPYIAENIIPSGRRANYSDYYTKRIEFSGF